MAMSFNGLETFYESLAEAIDAAGPRERELFLTRLALMLANELDEPNKALSAIDASLKAGQAGTVIGPAAD